MKWMNRLRIMPLLVVVAALSFGVRFGEFVSGVNDQPGVAIAQSIEPSDGGVLQTEAQEADEASPPSEPLDGIIATTANGDASETNPSPTTTDITASEPVYDWRDAGDTDFESSGMRMELFEELKSRRKVLDEKARGLLVREALLKAAEQEIEQKYEELLSLRGEIQELLVEQDEEEKARVASLVKIYEGMKPKDAANIFNSLNLDVLLSVVSKMSERKSAPIIASMNPERARTLTIMLMEQKALPTLSDDGFNP